MLEKGVTNQVLLAMSKLGTRLLRNNTGTAYRGEVKRLTDGSVLIRNPQLIKFGLCKGGADYIGWHPLKITPEMVGRTYAIYVAAEMKRTKGGRLSDDQKNFLEQVRSAGGMAGVANSVEAALSLYDQLTGPDHAP